MNTEISRYLVDANGNSFSSDTDLQSLSKNAKVKNTNSGVSYKKVQGTTSGVPVFDKVPFQEGQPDAVLYSQQSLTTAQKQQARTNIGASGGDAVLYSQQTLTSAEKEQARANIGAIDLATGRNNFVSTTSSQTFDISTTNRILKNIGIEHVTSNGSPQGKYCSRLAIGNTQILYGRSSYCVATHENLATMTADSIRYYTAMFKYPFISAPLVLGTPFITVGDDNATCGAIGYSSSPRAYLFGTGSPDHVSRVFYGAIGQSFPLDENAYVDSGMQTMNGRYYIQIPKENIKLTSSTCYFLVDMFISSNAPGSDYIEFDTMTTGPNVQADFSLGVGKSRISNTSGFDGNHYTRGFDVDLSFNPDSTHNDAEFMGYNDISDRKLFTNITFGTYKMASFIVSASSSSISGDSFPHLDLTFNMSLSSGVYGRIRVFYIPGTTGGSSSGSSGVVPGGSSSGGSSSGGSSSGGSSPSSTSGTWGVKKFNTVNGDVGQPTMSVGQTVSEGKIVKIYALTHWSQRSESDWGALKYTDWYYIWKDDNYTLTNADKSKINNLPSQSDYGSTPQDLPHVILSYNSGNI